MKTRKSIIIILLFIIGLASGILNANSNDTACKPVLSGSMNFDQIQKALIAYPPDYRYAQERLQIFQSMDAHFTFSVRLDDYQKHPVQVNQLKNIVEFYRSRVDQGLDALEKMQPEEGEVYVFKFYSSSLILKSSKGIVAIDFAQGPVGNRGEPENNDTYKTEFYLTAVQRDRLAKLVDIYLITHRHFDHSDFSLAYRMRKMGKIVVATQQLQDQWARDIRGITVPKYGSFQKLDFIEIFTHFGYQYGTSKTLEDGSRIGIPSDNLNRDSESIRYLIKIENMIFLHSAENQVEAYDWLVETAAKGWTVDVVLSRGQRQGEKSVSEFLDKHNNTFFFIPLHEYEMTHAGGGNKMARHLTGSSLKTVQQKRSMPLIWGEYFCIKRNDGRIVVK